MLWNLYWIFNCNIGQKFLHGFFREFLPQVFAVLHPESLTGFFPESILPIVVLVGFLHKFTPGFLQGKNIEYCCDVVAEILLEILFNDFRDSFRCSSPNFLLSSFWDITQSFYRSYSWVIYLGSIKHFLRSFFLYFFLLGFQSYPRNSF